MHHWLFFYILYGTWNKSVKNEEHNVHAPPFCSMQTHDRFWNNYLRYWMGTSLFKMSHLKKTTLGGGNALDKYASFIFISMRCFLIKKVKGSSLFPFFGNTLIYLGENEPCDLWTLTEASLLWRETLLHMTGNEATSNCLYSVAVHKICITMSLHWYKQVKGEFSPIHKLVQASWLIIHT